MPKATKIIALKPLSPQKHTLMELLLAQNAKNIECKKFKACFNNKSIKEKDLKGIT